MNIDDSALYEKISLKMLGLSFTFKLDLCCYIDSIAKTASKKLEPSFVLLSFFLLMLLRISMNLNKNLAWDVVVITGLVLLGYVEYTI